MLQTKRKHFRKLCKTFFTEKGFHFKQKFTLKPKRGVTLKQQWQIFSIIIS